MVGRRALTRPRGRFLRNQLRQVRQRPRVLPAVADPRGRRADDHLLQVRLLRPAVARGLTTHLTARCEYSETEHACLQCTVSAPVRREYFSTYSALSKAKSLREREKERERERESERERGGSHGGEGEGESSDARHDRPPRSAVPRRRDTHVTESQSAESQRSWVPW
jgi:hypothetical protein